MNLYINSPSYYTQVYGVLDEVYDMCCVISQKIDITRYTDVLDTIGITPILAPNSEKEKGQWLDYQKVSMKARMASISLGADYDIFCDADMDMKKYMILENILRSLYVIKKKLKNKFDYECMKFDIVTIAKAWIDSDFDF
ncbi:MAG: hypothetical protein IJ489_06885 [Clostridia bacterium]|nr:hypothetical protein [Clostridia bacterium]